MVGPVSGESQYNTSTEANSHSSHDTLAQDETTVTDSDNIFLTNQIKGFFTAEEEQEPDIMILINIPRSRHGEVQYLVAKEKELQDFSDFDVGLPEDAMNFFWSHQAHGADHQRLQYFLQGVFWARELFTL